jgi:FkbH-like protein
MEFATELPEKKKTNGRGKKVKCIVWDLDNTLWDGILVEDGPEHIKVRPGVVDVIKETDGRGILHSIASKNNHDEAVEVLRKHGLDEYFLYPQIGWQAKSQSIAKIAQLLNIGTGSLAFVDDQVFEREEVASLHPEVTTIDAAEYEVIAQRPECQAPITDESRARRQMYRTQLKREADLDAHHGDYFGFLRACEMEIHIWHLSDENLRRVYELAQRTNQMNFSGSRYKEDQLREIMASRNLETCVISCNDRFGEYGIVGFAVIDLEKPALIDLMFSCRVQSKRVEHAVLTFLLQRFVTAEGNDFYANYRRTDRNAPSGKVFEEMGFESLSENDGVSLLIFRRQQQILDDNIVKVFAQG